MNCDLKRHGYEHETLNALRRYRFVDRTMVCSVFASSLRGVKQLEPAATTGLYPWDRYGFSDSAWTALLVPAGVMILQILLPLRVVGLVSGADATSPS